MDEVTSVLVELLSQLKNQNIFTCLVIPGYGAVDNDGKGIPPVVAVRVGDIRVESTGCH